MATGHTRRIWIGTSGWTYDSWRGPFYPETIAKKRWLAWYGTRFHTTEINGSFYRTPSLPVVLAWRDHTPKDFVFSWKASKFITHWKRLNESSRSSVDLMLTRLKCLNGKSGPVLFQLPARFTANPDRLASFLKALPKTYDYVFEFRHESWYAPNVIRLLREHGVALCLSDHHEAPAPWTVTAPHVYIRGHGPSGRYTGRYPGKTLDRWSSAIRRWIRQGHVVYVYFDNDQKSAAPRDAQRLVDILVKDRSTRKALAPSSDVEP